MASLEKSLGALGLGWGGSGCCWAAAGTSLRWLNSAAWKGHPWTRLLHLALDSMNAGTLVWSQALWSLIPSFIHVDDNAYSTELMHLKALGILKKVPRCTNTCYQVIF